MTRGRTQKIHIQVYWVSLWLYATCKTGMEKTMLEKAYGRTLIFYLFFIDNLNAKFSYRVGRSIGHDEVDFF